MNFDKESKSDFFFFWGGGGGGALLLQILIEIFRHNHIIIF